MAKQVDFLLDGDLDLVINNGDAVQINATNQNQQKLFVLSQGDLKHEPLIGIGLYNWLLDDGDDNLALLKTITEQLESDGQLIKKLDVLNFPQIKLEAVYA